MSAAPAHPHSTEEPRPALPWPGGSLGWARGREVCPEPVSPRPAGYGGLPCSPCPSSGPRGSGGPHLSGSLARAGVLAQTTACWGCPLSAVTWRLASEVQCQWPVGWLQGRCCCGSDWDSGPCCLSAPHCGGSEDRAVACQDHPGPLHPEPQVEKRGAVHGTGGLRTLRSPGIR